MSPRVTKLEIATARGIGGVDYAAPKPVGQVPIGPVYTSTDVAELAARLGSIDTFDRRGNVIFADDFESGISKWTQDIVTPGGSIEWSAERARSGAFSAKLVTAAGDGSQVGMWAAMPYPVLGRLGFEFSFMLADYKIDVVDIDTSFYDGTYRHRSIITWDSYTNKFRYFDGVEYHNLEPAIDIPREMILFHTAKMVVDYNQEDYLRFIFDSISFDLSGKSYGKSLSGEAPQLVTGIYILNGSTGATTAYTDDVIVTQNEPPNPGG